MGLGELLEYIVYFLLENFLSPTLAETLQVLVCGDNRGNLVLFPLLKSALLGSFVASDVKISALNFFKGAHGISTVTSVAVARLLNQIEIRSV